MAGVGSRGFAGFSSQQAVAEIMLFAGSWGEKIRGRLGSKSSREMAPGVRGKRIRLQLSAQVNSVAD